MIVWVVFVQTNWMQHVDKGVVWDVCKVSYNDKDNVWFSLVGEQAQLLFGSHKSCVAKSDVRDSPNLLILRCPQISSSL